MGCDDVQSGTKFPPVCRKQIAPYLFYKSEFASYEHIELWFHATADV